MSRYRLEFTLMGLPAMLNSKRRAGHWAQLQREASRWKREVAMTIGNRKPVIPLKQANLTLIRGSSVRPDYDGLVSGFKHIIDGLVAAQVIENDREENIGIPDYSWKQSAPGEGFIQVIVEER